MVVRQHWQLQAAQVPGVLEVEESGTSSNSFCIHPCKGALADLPGADEGDHWELAKEPRQNLQMGGTRNHRNWVGAANPSTLKIRTLSPDFHGQSSHRPSAPPSWISLFDRLSGLGWQAFPGGIMKSLLGRSLLAAVGALLLNACSSSICDRAGSVNQGLEQKAAPCTSGDGGITMDVGTIPASCEEKAKSCTSDDVAKLNKMFDCMEKLPACAKGGELAWFGQIAGCAQGNEPSAACNAAFDEGSADGGM